MSGDGPGPTDEELHRRWRDGDQRAGRRLVDRYFRQMHRFFANKVIDATDVEDLAVETFERCVRALDSYRGDAKFRTFLYGIARNVLREYFRQRVRREGEVDVEDVAVRDMAPSPSTLLGELAEQRLLLEALRSIPLKYQITLELKFFENRTADQIAQIQDRPVGTINTWIRTGKLQLLAAMERLAESSAVLHSTTQDLEGWAASIRALLADEPESGA